MAAPTADAKPVTRVPVQLDVQRHIEFTNLARFKLGALEQPFDFADLRDRRRSYAALVAWVWACLVPEDAAAFASPAALAPHITVENQRDVAAALMRALAAAGDDAKNARGSTSKPSSKSS